MTRFGRGTFGTGTLTELEDATLPKRVLSEVPVSALAAEAERAIQIAVPAPATMTERRMLVARGKTREPFISTPPGSREPMVAFILGRD
ncbi:hypothetical protein DM791_20355 [Paenarthrobacter nitroguajacolicus]|nr:hypothetical protein [Paenarthrobacter nitroguajacolicus]NWL35225.1 hypothetical protein [Paenarthrobacter nitroguajacolicus]